MKITVWLARDDDSLKDTFLWTNKPVWDEKEKGYFPADDRDCDYIKMPDHYGLKPGECIPATLVIGEKKEQP